MAYSELHTCTAVVRDALVLLEPLDKDGEPVDFDVDDGEIESGQLKVIWGNRCFRVSVEVLS